MTDAPPPARPPITVSLTDDSERYLRTDRIVWFEEPPTWPVESQLKGVPADQRFAAEVPEMAVDSFAGIYGVRRLRLGVPGDSGADARSVTAAGLTWVGVHPDHRRQGVLTAMLRDHFRRCRDEGAALSVLHASEPAIYGRHGYGQAADAVVLTLSSGTTLNAPGLAPAARSLTTRFTNASDDGVVDRILACAEADTAAEVGVVSTQRDFFWRFFNDSPVDARGKEPSRAIFASRDGRDEGVVTFRRTQNWEASRPQGVVEIGLLLGTPTARLALLRRVLDLDLISTVKLPGVGPDDPLLSWMGPRAAAKTEFTDNLWVRLIDLPAALALRGYAADCDIVVEVSDKAAGWNAGRWRIVVAHGEATAERTEADADLDLPVEALGAAYLGGSDLRALHRAGQLTERRPGAIAGLAATLRTPLAPAAAMGF